jgi:hypothetical protein
MNYRDHKEEILMATDYGWDVYREFVVPNIKLGKNVLSPLREERVPSFCIYRHATRGDIWYKDFTETDMSYKGDCFQFVQAKFGLSTIKEAITLIKERVLGIYSDNPLKVKEVIRQNYKPKIIEPTVMVEFDPIERAWNNSDLQFFSRFMIYKSRLMDFLVFPVSKFKMFKNGKTTEIYERPNDPIYCIKFPSGRMKFYKPHTAKKQFKWLSNTVADEDVFGMHLLPDKCTDLFIMAGNKDTISFSCTTGIPVIALNAESVYMPQMIALFLETVAERIHVLYDNDNPGRKAEEKICSLNGYFSHGYLLQQFHDKEGNMINDYAQLIDVNKNKISEIRRFFAMLKESMIPKVKQYFAY